MACGCAKRREKIKKVINGVVASVQKITGRETQKQRDARLAKRINKLKRQGLIE